MSTPTTPTPDYGEPWKTLQPELSCHRLRTWKTLHHTINNTPTPETDGMTFFAQPGMMPPYNTVSSEFARKLERERDAALAANAAMREAIREAGNALIKASHVHRAITTYAQDQSEIDKAG